MCANSLDTTKASKSSFIKTRPDVYWKQDRWIGEPVTVYNMCVGLSPVVDMGVHPKILSVTYPIHNMLN